MDHPIPDLVMFMTWILGLTWSLCKKKMIKIYGNLYLQNKMNNSSTSNQSYLYFLLISWVLLKVYDPSNLTETVDQLELISIVMTWV